VRTAQARFCGSRDGQPSRLPDNGDSRARPSDAPGTGMPQSGSCYAWWMLQAVVRQRRSSTR